ncbi:hypothetical protein ACFXGA_06175 [Actinosynnema sp. NPDC059335]|uniref:hypothetical protein n=1 Tax=Actinosynnema sp. NPDC059335 TaxID=3346804 RepID=UPI003673106B
MTSRTTAGREVVSSATRLMDGLLDAEHRAFDQLDAAVQRVADATRQRIVKAAGVGRTRLLRADLLPDDDWLGELLLPPVSELTALARVRATTVVERQMRAVADLVGPHARDVAAAAVRHARDVAAPEIERTVFAAAGEGMQRAAAGCRELIREQRRVWAARHEEPVALVARVCSAERVPLPGASARGAVWLLRTRMHAIARAASVETANGLLLAGMQGWNDAAQAQG